MREVSADKAYLSQANLHAVAAVGGTAYIPFKANSLPYPHDGQNPDSLWERAYNFYQLHRAEFLDFYHKRSNVETTRERPSGRLTSVHLTPAGLHPYPVKMDIIH